LCVSVAPTILISDFVSQLKGSSSHEANQKMGHKVLDWQTGYGVVSFGTKDLEWVREYVKNQRERHARGNVVDRLERIAERQGEDRQAEAEPREAP
jgi:putative transposase